MLFRSIEQGKAWIEGFLLYYVYDKWCYETNKKTQLSSNFFIQFCRLYFKHKQNNETVKLWFAVNDEFLLKHLPPEKIKSIQQARNNKIKKLCNSCVSEILDTNPSHSKQSTHWSKHKSVIVWESVAIKEQSEE